MTFSRWRREGGIIHFPSTLKSLRFDCVRLPFPGRSPFLLLASSILGERLPSRSREDVPAAPPGNEMDPTSGSRARAHRDAHASNKSNFDRRKHSWRGPKQFFSSLITASTRQMGWCCIDAAPAFEVVYSNPEWNWVKEEGFWWRWRRHDWPYGKAVNCQRFRPSSGPGPIVYLYLVLATLSPPRTPPPLKVSPHVFTV